MLTESDLSSRQPVKLGSSTNPAEEEINNVLRNQKTPGHIIFFDEIGDGAAKLHLDQQQSSSHGSTQEFSMLFLLSAWAYWAYLCKQSNFGRQMNFYGLGLLEWECQVEPPATQYCLPWLNHMQDTSNLKHPTFDIIWLATSVSDNLFIWHNRFQIICLLLFSISSAQEVFQRLPTEGLYS